MSSNNKVVVYSSSKCGFCDILKGRLDELEVDYLVSDINIPENKASLQRTGHATIPVVQVRSRKGHLIVSIADSSARTAELVKILHTDVQ